MSENVKPETDVIAPFVCDNCGQNGTAEEVLAGNAQCTRCKSGTFESFTIDDAEVIASLRTQLQEAQESAARAENAWKNAEAELRKNGIDGNGIVDALIFGFNMVYTSPAWGDDERSPEGWKQKEAALRKEFSATVKKAITLFMVFLEFAKERLRVKDDCLQVKVKEVAILRTALAAAEERARVAEEENGKLIGDRVMLGWLKVEREKRREFEKGLVAWRKKCHEGMDEIERLTAEVEEWKKKAENALTESAHAHGMAEMLGYRNGNLVTDLRTLRRTSVRVDVLLRWIQSRSRVLSILGGSIMSRAGTNPGEQAKALLSWLTAVLHKRQSRLTTNTKGE